MFDTMDLTTLFSGHTLRPSKFKWSIVTQCKDRFMNSLKTRMIIEKYFNTCMIYQITSTENYDFHFVIKKALSRKTPSITHRYR